MSNAHYWVDKESRAKQAEQHTKEMYEKYQSEIDSSINDTNIFDGDITVYHKDPISIPVRLIDADSVSAVLDSSGKTCVLNFASFKNPGGMFIKGSKAQEECLCHESTLYNVLKEFEEYYEFNRQNLNRALYHNRALYSPNIVFERNGQVKKADVLTCAAPNFSAANKYCNVDKATNSGVLRNRIRFILSILAARELDTIILGAYGCGVFGQDPTEVATMFIEEISHIFNKRVNVIFAIMDDHKTNNYQSFKSIIEKGN